MKSTKSIIGPWQSVLWDHLEEIKDLRKQRKKWTEIAELFSKKNPPINMTHRAIRAFFVRSRKPKRRIPAGFEDTVVSGKVKKKRALVQKLFGRTDSAEIPKFKIRSEPHPMENLPGAIRMDTKDGPIWAAESND